MGTWFFVSHVLQECETQLLNICVALLDDSWMTTCRLDDSCLGWSHQLSGETTETIISCRCVRVIFRFYVSGGD